MQSLLFLLVFLSFFFLSFLSIITTAEDNNKNGAKYIERFYDLNKNYNKEREVLEKGKPFVLDLLRQRNESSRKELLCATFMNGGNAMSNRMLYVNMRKLGSVCDFAIVLYKGHPRDVNMCNRSNPLANILFCDRAKATLPPSPPAPKGVYPKPLLYMELLPFLQDYRRVFLIDEDISLFKFDYKIFSAVWNCGFYPAHPPLITQALVSEGTQWFPYVHFDKWKEGRKSLIWAAESVFIEQQAPLLDSVFFHWLLEFVLKPTLTLSLQTGSDWGTDIVWCYAAYHYAREILGVTEEGFAPCALLTKAPPVVHRDGKTIGFKKAHFQEFNNEGFRMVGLYRELFPTWMANHTAGNFNPLEDENNHLIKRYKLNKECYPGEFNIL